MSGVAVELTEVSQRKKMSGLRLEGSLDIFPGEVGTEGHLMALGTLWAKV